MIGERFDLMSIELQNGKQKDGSWLIRGETYTFVESFSERYTDGFSTIVQRESDKKYFQYFSECKTVWLEVYLKPTTVWEYV